MGPRQKVVARPDNQQLSPLGHDLIADLIIAYFKRQGGTTSWWGKKKPKQASMHKVRPDSDSASDSAYMGSLMRLPARFGASG